MRITSPRRFFTFLAVLVLLLILGGWGLWGNATLQQSGDVVVEAGDSARAVGRKLLAEGYLSRALPWRYYASRLAATDTLKAGTYHLERGERVPAVLARMVAGDTVPDELTVTFPEGFTLEQMAARVGAREISSAREFSAAATVASFADQFAFLRELPPTRSLEGYLFPDTYKVFADDKPENIIVRMLTNFDVKVTPELRAEAAASGRSLDQIVTMASIIEREVIHDEDMALVSGVLWKRFDEGMGLDADATIRYAVNNWETPLTVEQLRIDSPYNTRRYRGLPPGPISNPGLRALIAAVRPQTSDYYYYLSTPEGETVFARTNDEHNANKAKHLQ